MKNLIVKISLVLLFPVLSLANDAVQVEVWSRGLSARMELKPRGAHYEMTVRMNGGQSTWKQVHHKDVSALITKISALEGLVTKDQAKDKVAQEIKTSGCRAGWVRMRPQRPGDWRACLDQPTAGRSVAVSARKANELATTIADAFEKLVKAPEAPIVLRPGGRGEEPEAIIQFAETEDDRMARIESEVQEAERFANEQQQTERLRQKMIASDRGRDPFHRQVASPAKVRAASKSAARELKRLESLVQSVEKYVSETPSIVDSGLQKARKFAPSKKDILAPVDKAKSQTAGPRAP